MRSQRAQRKQRRRIEVEAEARVARFWRKPGSAERMGHTQPVDRNAAKELSASRSRKRQS